MKIDKRRVLTLGAGGMASALLPMPARARDNGAEAEIRAFTGGVVPGEGGVILDIPDLAENGYSVPVTLTAPGASAILLVANANPDPVVGLFTFGPLAVRQRIETKIRLARTQEVIAVARRPDGSFAEIRRPVTVIVGGCGGDT